MRPLPVTLVVVLVLVSWHPWSGERTLHGQFQALTIAPGTPQGVRDWDGTVNRMLRTRDLRVRRQRPDTIIPGRTLEQLDQYSNGVRVWGGSVSRQIDRNGVTAISVFGTLYADAAIDVAPALGQSDAKAAIERIGEAELGSDRLPELVLLPTDDGRLRLAWVGEIFTVDDCLRLFLDAHTGGVLRRESVLQTQVPDPVGRARGVLGDEKKISTLALSGAFVAFDTLRPPDIRTYDLRSNLNRGLQFLNGTLALAPSDLATSPNNDWTDGASVDAHVYSSYTYDYYYKRFGRRGLDNADRRILNMTHLVNRNDFRSASANVIGLYYLNAFYAGDGVMVYGEGLPANVYLTSTGSSYNFFSGALDIVAHELTHGVTEYSSNLEYRNESGALNESFSDIMATSVEFFFQPSGHGLMKADYLVGEDIARAVIAGASHGVRSMANPAQYGHPDHYSRRFTGTRDNGGVHINSGIPNQAYYLAIEGGTNRTSGIRVQGVGPSNREQIEKVFYRAFAQLMPSNANFAMARAVTLRAAEDLYGSNSPPYSAVRDAWTAVGVN